MAIQIKALFSVDTQELDKFVQSVNNAFTTLQKTSSTVLKNISKEAKESFKSVSAMASMLSYTMNNKMKSSQMISNLKLLHDEAIKSGNVIKNQLGKSIEYASDELGVLVEKIDRASSTRSFLNIKRDIEKLTGTYATLIKQAAVYEDFINNLGKQFSKFGVAQGRTNQVLYNTVVKRLEKAKEYLDIVKKQKQKLEDIKVAYQKILTIATKFNQVSNVLNRLHAPIIKLREAFGGVTDFITKSMYKMNFLVSQITHRLHTMVLTIASIATTGGLIKLVDDMRLLDITLMKVTNSTKEYTDAWSFVIDFAKTTPFTMQQVMDAFVKLRAYGLDPTDGTLRSIVDAVAALGGSEREFTGIVRALGQIRAKGKLMAQEVRQLMEAQIPVYDILQEELGLTADKIDDIGKQAISASEFIQAFNMHIQKTFGGTSKARMQTLAGQFSNLKDNIQKIVTALFTLGGTYDWILDKFTSFNEFLSSLNKDTITMTVYAAKFGSVFRSVIRGVVSGLREYFNIMKDNTVIKLFANYLKTSSRDADVLAQKIKNLITLFARFQSLAITFAGVGVAANVLNTLVGVFDKLFQVLKHSNKYMKDMLISKVLLTTKLQEELPIVASLLKSYTGLKNVLKANIVLTKNYAKQLYALSVAEFVSAKNASAITGALTGLKGVGIIASLSGIVAFVKKFVTLLSKDFLKVLLSAGRLIGSFVSKLKFLNNGLLGIVGAFVAVVYYINKFDSGLFKAVKSFGKLLAVVGSKGLGLAFKVLDFFVSRLTIGFMTIAIAIVIVVRRVKWFFKTLTGNTKGAREEIEKLNEAMEKYNDDVMRILDKNKGLVDSFRNQEGAIKKAQYSMGDYLKVAEQLNDDSFTQLLNTSIEIGDFTAVDDVIKKLKELKILTQDKNGFLIIDKDNQNLKRLQEINKVVNNISTSLRFLELENSGQDITILLNQFKKKLEEAGDTAEKEATKIEKLKEQMKDFVDLSSKMFSNVKFDFDKDLINGERAIKELNQQFEDLYYTLQYQVADSADIASKYLANLSKEFVQVKIDVFKKQLSDVNDYIKKLTKELDDYKKGIEKIQDRLKSAISEIDKSLAEQDTTKAKEYVSSLVDEYEKLKREANALSKEMYYVKLAYLEGAISYEEYINQLSKLQQQQAEAYLKQYEAYKKAKQEAEALKQPIYLTTSEVEDLRDKMDRLQKKIDDTSSQKIDILNKDIKDAKSQASNLVDTINELNKVLSQLRKVDIKTEVDMYEVYQLKKEIDELNEKTITINVKYREENKPGYKTGGFVIPRRFATGGWLAGYGGGDKIEALLEAGEFVIRKEAVKAFGVDFFNKLNNLQLPNISVAQNFTINTPKPEMKKFVIQIGDAEIEGLTTDEVLRAFEDKMRRQKFVV